MRNFVYNTYLRTIICEMIFRNRALTLKFIAVKIDVTLNEFFCIENRILSEF